MEPSRFLVIEFLDGKKETFIFPAQADNSTARKLRIEEFLKGHFLTLQLENEVQVFPVSAIRSIRLSGFSGVDDPDALPMSAIRGAEHA